MNARPPFRIALVDDHPVMLDGYRNMLAGQPDLEVCGTATNAADAVSLVERTGPDLLVTDFDSPGPQRTRPDQGSCRIASGFADLVISMHDENLWAERTLKAGAKGYVMKESDSATMLAAIRQVLGGGVYLSPQLAARVIGAFASARPRGSAQSPLEKLTDREFEIFRLFGEGQTAKEIAARLNLSPETVSVHRDHVEEKMGYQTSAEMIREAVRWVESSG